MGKKSKDEDTADKLDRIAIVNAERCRPKKCKQECKRSVSYTHLTLPTKA